MPDNSSGLAAARGNTAPASQTIVVADKDVVISGLALPGRISVETVVEDGGAIGSFRLRLNDATFTGPPPGRQLPFRPNVPPGEYRVSVEGLQAGYIVKSAVYEGVDVLKNPLRIMADSAGVLLLRLARDQRAAFKIRGTVTALEMLPRAGARRVSLRGPDSWMDNATIGDDGAFEFPALYPGVYRLRVESGAGPASLMQNVTITDHDVVGVELQAEPPSEVTLRVTASGGLPSPGLVLRLAAVPPLTGVQISTTPAPSGRAMTLIRPGDYSVEVGVSIRHTFCNR
jgi:hypothetical protein